MIIKKYLSFFILTFALVMANPSAFAADDQASGIMDDSLRDISVVLGAGAAGAILGLSTLSFVDTPSKHLKNIAVGGAIGIVVGVAAVIVMQASKTTSTIGQTEIPLNSEKYATLTRQEFTNLKIAQDHLKEPSIGFNFDF